MRARRRPGAVAGRDGRRRRLPARPVRALAPAASASIRSSRARTQSTSISAIPSARNTASTRCTRARSPGHGGVGEGEEVEAGAVRQGAQQVLQGQGAGLAQQPQLFDLLDRGQQIALDPLRQQFRRPAAPGMNPGGL